jgi:hypothetical protein
LQHDCLRLLNPSDSADPLQAVQFTSPDGEEAVILVFRGESTKDSVQLPLLGLQRERSYEVTFANDGSVTEQKGGELLSHGITVSLPSRSISEIVLMKAR